MSDKTDMPERMWVSRAVETWCNYLMSEAAVPDTTEYIRIDKHLESLEKAKREQREACAKAYSAWASAFVQDKGRAEPVILSATTDKGE